MRTISSFLLQSYGRTELRAPHPGAWLFVDSMSFAFFIYDIVYDYPMQIISHREIDDAVVLVRSVFESLGYRFAAQSSGRKIDIVNEAKLIRKADRKRANFEKNMAMLTALKNDDLSPFQSTGKHVQQRRWHCSSTLRHIRKAIQNLLPCPPLNVHGDDDTTILYAYHHFPLPNKHPRYVLSSDLDFLQSEDTNLLLLSSINQAMIKALFSEFKMLSSVPVSNFLTPSIMTSQSSQWTCVKINREQLCKFLKISPSKLLFLSCILGNAYFPGISSHQATAAGSPVYRQLHVVPAIHQLNRFLCPCGPTSSEPIKVTEKGSRCSKCGKEKTLTKSALLYLTTDSSMIESLILGYENAVSLSEVPSNPEHVTPGVQVAPVKDGFIHRLVVPPSLKFPTLSHVIYSMKLLGILPPALCDEPPELEIAASEISQFNQYVFQVFTQSRLNLLNTWLTESTCPVPSEYDSKEKRNTTVKNLEDYLKFMKSIRNVTSNQISDTLLKSDPLMLLQTLKKMRREIDLGGISKVASDLMKISQLSDLVRELFTSRFTFLQIVPPLVRRKLVIEMLWESAWECPSFATPFHIYNVTSSAEYALPKIFENAYTFTSQFEFRTLKYSLFAASFQVMREQFTKFAAEKPFPVTHLLCYLAASLISSHEQRSQIERDIAKVTNIQPSESLYIRSAYDNFSSVLDGHETLWKYIENPFVPESPADMISLDEMGLLVAMNDPLKNQVKKQFSDFEQFDPNTFTLREIDYKNYGVELPSRISYYASWKTFAHLLINSITFGAFDKPEVKQFLQKYIVSALENGESAKALNPSRSVSKSDMFTRDARRVNMYIFHHLLAKQLKHEQELSQDKEDVTWDVAFSEMSSQFLDILVRYPDIYFQLNTIVSNVASAVNEVDLSTFAVQQHQHSGRISVPISNMDYTFVPICSPADLVEGKRTEASPKAAASPAIGTPITITPATALKVEPDLVPSPSNPTSPESEPAPAIHSSAATLSAVPVSSAPASTHTATLAPTPSPPSPVPDDAASPDTPVELRHDYVLSNKKIRIHVDESEKGLPIYKARKLLLRAIAKNTVTFISASTGSGKSSRVPLFLYERSWGSADKGVSDTQDPIPWASKLPANIYCSIPTRVAAQSLAQYVATMTKQKKKVGEIVGYRLGQGASMASADTRISFCTAGWLVTAMFHLIQPTETASDELLSKSDFSLFGVPVTHVVIDEAHVRSVHVDILLLMMKLVITKYCAARIRVMKQIYEIFDPKEMKNLDVSEETYNKAVEMIHDIYANRTRWIIMSATIEIMDIVEYMQSSLNRFTDDIEALTNCESLLLQEKYLNAMRESLFKLSISRAPKNSFRGTIATVAENLRFDPCPLDVITTDTPTHLQIVGTPHKVSVYHIEDILASEKTPQMKEILGYVKQAFDSLQPKVKQGQLRLPSPERFQFLASPFVVKATVSMCRHLVSHDPFNSALIFVAGREDIETIMMEFELFDETLEPFTAFKSQSEQIPALVSMTYALIPLHGMYESADLQEVIDHKFPKKKKIYIATNVVETSLTIVDLDIVFDLGFHYEAKYDSTDRRNVLDKKWISKSSAIQRAGRVGRLGPGRVFRMYPKSCFDLFQEYSSPEITNTPLDDLVLQVQSDQSRHIINELTSEYSDELPKYRLMSMLIMPPDEASITRTFKHLYFEEVLTTPYPDSALTSLGSSLTACPFDSASSRVLFFGTVFNCLPEAVVIAAILSSENIFRRVNPKMPKAKFVQTVKSTVESVVRAGIVRPPHSKEVGYLYSDLLSVLNVYLNLMQHPPSQRGKMLFHFAVHQKRFERLCMRVRYYAGIAKSHFKSSKDISPLFKTVLSPQEIKSLFSFDITRYRIFMFTIFYQNLTYRSDTEPLKFTLRSDKPDREVEKDTVKLVEDTMQISLRLEKASPHQIMSATMKHLSQEPATHLGNLARLNIWFAPSPIPTANAANKFLYPDNFADYYLTGLARSNNKFFSYSTPDTLKAKGKGKGVDDEQEDLVTNRFQMGSADKWIAFAGGADRDPIGTDILHSDEYPDYMLHSRLDSVESKRITSSCSYFSPTALMPFAGDRLFAVGAKSLDIGVGNGAVRHMEYLNAITACSRKLALYYYSFINPLKMEFSGDFGTVSFFSTADEFPKEAEAFINEENDLIDELTITTLFHQVTLYPSNLRLDAFRKLFTFRRQLKVQATIMSPDRLVPIADGAIHYIDHLTKHLDH